MTDLVACMCDARARRDHAAVIDLIPYARFLGMDFLPEDDGRLLFRLPFSERNVGNPAMPALHGGVVGAFMEHAAITQLLWDLETELLPRVVDFSIDYLRSGLAETAYARCRVLRQGARIANVSVETWQSDPGRTVATARGHFLLSPR